MAWEKRLRQALYSALGGAALALLVAAALPVWEDPSFFGLGRPRRLPLWAVLGHYLGAARRMDPFGYLMWLDHFFLSPAVFALLVGAGAGLASYLLIWAAATSPRRSTQEAAPVIRAPQEVGALQRDAQPHRAHWLRVLGGVSMAVAAASVILTPLCLISFPLALEVRRMARGDLDKMAAGLMDPRGRSGTLIALDYGTVAALLTVCGMLLCSACCAQTFLRN